MELVRDFKNLKTMKTVLKIKTWCTISFGIIFLLLFFSCEKPGDCFESTGNIIKKDVAISSFTKLEVHRGIAVEITQGTNYGLQIEAGENQIGNINITQNGNTLKLEDNTSCSWLREYGSVKIYVTAPNIEEIYSKTDRNISSNGVLNYPNLWLKAFDKEGDNQDEAGTGDFILNLNCNQFNIDSNTLPRFIISGNVTNATFNIWANDCRIEAQDLTIQNFAFYHRGSNDMIVKPMVSITGTLVSSGNVICKNHPPTVNVQVNYTGRLIFD